ncbi:extracellular solute-binding protein [Seminavis robusta]|uniref:Extracellular solute-binding protein n=1 Tax=Seminavis robusta TaxID=568900 RepID=A0A9N8ELP0_9STRA|nr:extracellular solute-binding protein [Seminavis robusta]|eukprot:Sro1411_g270440.1 extracellular solute-binding protein (823) ;mRNA; r:26643-29367
MDRPGNHKTTGRRNGDNQDETSEAAEVEQQNGSIHAEDPEDDDDAALMEVLQRRSRLAQEERRQHQSEQTAVDVEPGNKVSSRSSQTSTVAEDVEVEEEKEHPQNNGVGIELNGLFVDYSKDKKLDGNAALGISLGADQCISENVPDVNANATQESLPGAYACDGIPSNEEGSGESVDEEHGVLLDTATAPMREPQPETPMVLEARLAPTASSFRTPVSAAVEHCNDDVIEAVTSPTGENNQALPLLGILVLLAVVVLMVVGLTGAFTSDDSNPSTPTKLPAGGKSSIGNLTRMERIQEAGVLRCGFNVDRAVTYFDETGELVGFDPTMCRIFASAMSVEPEFVPMEDGQRFPEIVNDAYDVLIRGVTHTMERSIHEATTKAGIAFSVPYLYEGVKLAGDPFYVDQCANKNLKHIDECTGIRVCVFGPDTTHYRNLAGILPKRFLVPVAANQEIGSPLEGLVNGTCNLQGNGIVAEKIAREAGYKGPYHVGKDIYSKDPLAIVTHSEDPEFSDFVQSILRALLAAEFYNITRDKASIFPETHVFGEQYKHAFQKALSVGGHFGTLYAKYWEELIPRSSLNFINDGNTGLLYSHPLGDLLHDRGDRPLGHRLQSILDRGVLRCGIRLGRPGFASLSETGRIEGMDVDYCRAVAASLYQSDDEAIEFVALEEPSDGYSKLATDEIDVVAGATLTLENDVREPATGLGFAFTQPYYFGFSESEDNFCLATMQDDNDWAMFTYWVVAATFYAEESSINSTVSNRMPEVRLFGRNLKRFFRDPVLMVGSYADIYKRNVEPIIPRGGRNMLNAYPDLGPQHYIVPGFV